MNSVAVGNTVPAADFSSLMQGMKDAVLNLSVRKQCRNEKCSKLIQFVKSALTLT